MPFKSKAQMRACFATKGFNGAIDCREYARETKSIKSLPDKKEKGGKNMYRPKNCKKCGGKMKMQDAGSFQINPALFRPKDDDMQPLYINEDSSRTTEQMYGPQYANRIQEGIAQGILEAPRADNPDEQLTAQQWYDMVNGQPSQKKRKDPYQTLQRIGIGMRAARTGLGWLSGIIERGRQNQYDYQQQTALGQMNPMQVDDFQPQGGGVNYYAKHGGMNPFSYYSKYGGNLKKIIKEFTNKAQFDFGSGDDDQGMMKKGGYEIDRMLVVRKVLPELLKMGRMGGHRYRNYQQGGMPRFPMTAGLTNAVRTKITLDGPEEVMYQKLNELPFEPIPYPTVDKTNYSFTYPDAQGQQATKYFPDMGAWQDFMKDKQYTSQQQSGDKSSASATGYLNPYKKGGIYIKPENRGKFTEYCGGEVTEECIQKALNSPSATIRKRANFARNARKWNK